MPIKLFKKEDSVVRKISASHSVSNYLTAKDSNYLSVAVGNAVNHNEIITTDSDRVYFILEGEITINDLKGKSGDLIYVPQNTKYSFSGTFKAVVINSPPFKSK